ncbi:unnamed protein product [Owenia fusiformis]|uniref:Dimethyladenosine transferase 2, mitochondrial n=1 Tax=Owenia fusiformis TaxID=6347 RepID=A0A8J1U2W8_OWEFU|nr:unnamed protein product [Owenia fusiformis]
MAYKSTCHMSKLLRLEARIMHLKHTGCLSNKSPNGVTNKSVKHFSTSTTCYACSYQNTSRSTIQSFRQWHLTILMKYGLPTQKLHIQFYHSNVMPSRVPAWNHTNIICKHKMSSKSKPIIVPQLWNDENNENIKERLLKARPESFVHYVFQKEIAKEIVDCLEPHLEASVPFLECNAGPGLLSQELLERGVEQLTVTQAHEQFLPYTQKLCDKSEGKMSHHAFKMNSLTSHKLYVKHDFLGHVQPKQWEAGIPLQMFNIICQSKIDFKQKQFLTYLINCCITEESIFSLGRTQTFLLIAGPMLKAILGEVADTHMNYNLFSRTRGVKILLNIIFDIEQIGKWRSDDFFPPLTIASSSKTLRGKDQTLHLVKMTPKLDLFEVLPHPTLVKLPMFVYHLLAGKLPYRTIPELEKWVPGCGIDLIANGFTMMEQLKEITAEQVITALKVLTSARGYPGSYLSSITLDDVYNSYFKNAPIILQNTSSYAKTLSWEPSIDLKEKSTRIS